MKTVIDYMNSGIKLLEEDIRQGENGLYKCINEKRLKEYKKRLGDLTLNYNIKTNLMKTIA